MLRTPSFAAALAVALLFVGPPSRAQFAFGPPSRAVLATGHGTEEPPKTTRFKLVRGVVQGPQGVLAGATVWLHGTRTIVATDADGEFELRVPADAPLIELTCGYAGLHDEVVRLLPAQALGSVYLLRPHAIR